MFAHPLSDFLWRCSYFWLVGAFLCFFNIITSLEVFLVKAKGEPIPCLQLEIFQQGSLVSLEIIFATMMIGRGLGGLLQWKLRDIPSKIPFRCCG